jgi:hypothetical protein
MYYWKQCLSFSCLATSYSGVFTIVTRICGYENVYRVAAYVVARLNMLTELLPGNGLVKSVTIFSEAYYRSHIGKEHI